MSPAVSIYFGLFIWPLVKHRFKRITVYLKIIITLVKDFKTVSLILLNPQIKKLLYENTKKLSATGRKPVHYINKMIINFIY